MRKQNIYRDSNGIVGSLISCVPVKSAKYNTRITLAIDQNYSFGRFIFLNPTTHLFTYVDMEADRRGVPVLACIKQLRKERVAIYQKVDSVPYYLNVDFMMLGNGKTTDAAVSFYYTSSRQRGDTFNKEVLIIDKVTPTPPAIMANRESLQEMSIRLAKALMQM